MKEGELDRLIGEAAVGERPFDPVGESSSALEEAGERRPARGEGEFDAGEALPGTLNACCVRGVTSCLGVVSAPTIDGFGSAAAAGVLVADAE